MNPTDPLDTGDVALFEAPVAADDPFAGVIGQDEAVAILRSSLRAPVHAYMLVGPHGSGKRSTALAFAAGLLSEGAGPADADRTTELVLAQQHPDLIIVEREGAAISALQADEIVRRASRSPMEGSRKVLLLDEFHLVSPAAASKLLKTIEEPPSGTFFLVLAEEVTPDLVTIASALCPDRAGVAVRRRCPERVGRRGCRARASGRAIVAYAQGDLARSPLSLATDPQLATRLQSWQSIPGRLDGRGRP